MRKIHALVLLSLLFLGLIQRPAFAADNGVKEAEGLWEYTGLVTRDGQSLPLTGVFLISKDVFLQQSIFNEEPFSTAGSMAHVGPYWAGGAGLRLRSDQTLSLDPKADESLRSLGVLEHDLKVERNGDELTLTFGGGTSTVQTFRHLGNAEDTQLIPFADGALALADGYFILVVGDSERVVSGYGGYTKTGTELQLELIRWAESDGESVTNRKDETITATLDDTALTLADGRRFAIKP